LRNVNSAQEWVRQVPKTCGFCLPLHRNSPRNTKRFVRLIFSKNWR
jgi:hypothetical protein